MNLIPNYFIFVLKILSNGSDYSASVYQNINHKLKTGISVAWSSTKDETSLGLGCIYKLDNDSCLRVWSQIFKLIKVNSIKKTFIIFYSINRPKLTTIVK